MFKFKRFILPMLAALLFACGDGDSLSSQPPVVDNDPDIMAPPSPVASIEALTDNPQLQSDGGIPVTISALVKDENNNFVEGEVVTFSASSGGVELLNGTTGANGVATARLSTAGNQENRVITVTTTVPITDGTLSDSVDVTVIGTNVQLNGPSALAQGAVATFTAVVNNANGQGIADETIEVTSALGNTISAQTLTTDSAGQAQFDYTAVNGGADTIMATALGESASTTVAIASDAFAFTSPNASTEIPLNTDQMVTLNWTQNNAPVSGQTVTFASTRGTVTPTTVVTNANGEASTVINASNAGTGIVTATTVNGPSASINLEFVATDPVTIEVQAEPFTIAPNSQSAITAIVRDINDNLVKNIVVNFDLDDITSGGLSTPSAVTDSQGRAQTFYTSSSQTSSVDGVEIKASFTTNGMTTSNAVNITVAGREVFFTFGTGNEISEPTPAQYGVPFVVQVTDADGRPVTDVAVTMSVNSVKFVKGYWCPNEVDDRWDIFVSARCDDEDQNRNGILEPEEDINGNNAIEAGNIATVLPGAFVTDSNGFGNIELRYPQQFGNFLEVELQARTSVQGTEFSESQVFLLPVLAADVETLDVSPPALLTVPENGDNIQGCFGLIEVPVDSGNFVVATPGVLYSSPFGYNLGCDVYDFPIDDPNDP